MSVKEILRRESKMKLSLLHGISAFFRKGIVLEDDAQVRDLFFTGKNNYKTKPKKLRRFFWIKSFHTS